MLIPTRLPGRWVWLFLVLALMAMVLLSVAANHFPLRLWFGPSFFVHARWIAGAGITWAGMVTVLVLRADKAAWTHRRLDRAFLLLVFSWVLCSTTVAVMVLFDSASWTVLLRHLAYQLSVAATLYFLRACMSRPTRLMRLLIIAQFTLGASLLVGANLAPEVIALWAIDAWRISNVLGFTALFLTFSRALFAESSYPPWLTLGACLMGFGLGLSDMATLDGTAIPISPMHSVFAIYLLMLWLLLSSRMGRFSVASRQTEMRSEHSILGSDFARSSLFEEPEHAASGEGTLELERMKRSIAQELHDGVGSQLVNMLASLDRREPQQQKMAQALEECLVDVKMLGDGIDGSRESVFEALARLRYRVQPSLDRLGISLIWNVNPSGALEALQDERVKQLIRIVQESLANVMRHSRAKTVKLSCGYVPEEEALLLSISDDGMGMDPSTLERPGGKGLQGMRRRAASICAEIEISSKSGRGTAIKLLMPLHARTNTPPKAHPSKQFSASDP